MKRTSFRLNEKLNKLLITDYAKVENKEQKRWQPHASHDSSTFQAFKSGCQRKPGKMLKMSTEGGQQNKFILTSQIGLVE